MTATCTQRREVLGLGEVVCGKDEGHGDRLHECGPVGPWHNVMWTDDGGQGVLGEEGRA